MAKDEVIGNKIKILLGLYNLVFCGLQYRFFLNRKFTGAGRI